MKDAEQIIRTIAREEAEMVEIHAALQARQDRLATMTDDEREMLNRLDEEEAKVWDFLNL